MTATEIATAPEIRAVQEKASGSSFYSAMRLMPKAEREAMFAIYAFCRAVDDIADDGIGTREERHEALNRWRTDLDTLYAGGTPRHGAFLKDAIATYGLRKEDFLAVIDGMDMDAAEDIRAPRSRHARSVLRPCGERGRAAFHQGVRHGRAGRDSRLPIIWAARCS